MADEQDKPKGVQVRILDAELRPTVVVGMLVRNRTDPTGPVCEVAWNQRRFVVPRRQVQLEANVKPMAGPKLVREKHNRDIDDVALPVDKTVRVEPLDIGTADGVVVPFPAGVDR